MPTILAVIVTYWPDLEQLQRLLTALMPQVSHCVIIDNTANSLLADWLKEQSTLVNNITLITPQVNLGLGAAHNLGIDYAKQHGYEFIIQFDQDSIPKSDLVEQLFRAYQYLTTTGHKVAAVGPTWNSADQRKQARFIRQQGWRKMILQCPIDDPTAIIQTDHVITSGCLFPLTIIDEVGKLNEDFFIDAVDIEWGLRAKAKGFNSYAVCSAQLVHELGEEVVNFLGRSFQYHSPSRHYYITRNAILLLTKPYISLCWKLSLLFSNLIRIVLYPIIFKPRFGHLKMMLTGLWHGLMGKTGPYK